MLNIATSIFRFRMDLIHQVNSISYCEWIDSKDLAIWGEICPSSTELRNNWLINCEHSQALGCVCYCGLRSHCPTIVNDNVSGDVFARCVCEAFQHLCALCVYQSRVPETRGDPVVSLLVRSRDNTLWRQRSLIIPFKRTERNPSSHPLLLLLLLPSPPLPPPLCSTNAQ